MVTISDPRYNMTVNLSNDGKDFSRTFSYVNTALGGSSSGYSYEDILEFAKAVASLSGDGGTTYPVYANSVNINAQYTIKEK